jgi:hypothetical protein
MFSKSSILYRYYHGENDDQIGQVGMFLNGTGRYTVLWETMTKEKSDRIAPGFGPISGLSRGSIEEVIRAPTLSGKKRIDGRQLLSKAKNALKESKILLAFWGEFVKMGMPSGMTEVDALKYVVDRAFEEKSAEGDDEEEDDDDEDTMDTCLPGSILEGGYFSGEENVVNEHEVDDQEVVHQEEVDDQEAVDQEEVDDQEAVDQEEVDDQEAVDDQGIR